MQQQVVLRTREMQLLEARRGKSIEEILRELYVERRLTVRQVGEELGVNAGTVSEWLARVGIPARRPGHRAELA